MTQAERKRIGIWLEAIIEEANRLGDQLDPKRLRQSSLVRKIDTIAATARAAKAYLA